jgi:hypothetical protein
MTQQDDRRRPPLYWFKHKHVEDLPLPFPPLSGVRPFCFFRSSEYAREFLQQWVPLHGIMNPWTGGRMPREVWILDGDNNADRLLAKCDEASQEGYEGFLIDPPLTTLQGLGSVLPLTLSDIKNEIEVQPTWKLGALASRWWSYEF